jgi:hypothetical protein
MLKKLIIDFTPAAVVQDVKRIRVCPKMYYSHAIQILEKTQSEAFLNFQQTHHIVFLASSESLSLLVLRVVYLYEDCSE